MDRLIYLISMNYNDGDGEVHKNPLCAYNSLDNAKLGCNSVYIENLENSIKIWTSELDVFKLTPKQILNNKREIIKLQNDINSAKSTKYFPIEEFSIDPVYLKEL